MSHQLESDLGTLTFEVLENDPLRIQIDGSSYEIEFVERGRSSTLLLVNGTPVELCAEGGSARLAGIGARLVETLGRNAAGASGSEKVVAPMPGRVVAIRCKPGDEVEAGQPLLVLEAMKMENELTAPCGGIVTALLTEEGAAIEAGAPLIELGPKEAESE